MIIPGFGFIPNMERDFLWEQGPTGNGTNDWLVWNKPFGVKFVSILAIGGGAGGGGGFTAASGTAKGGGGGGGGAAVTRTLFLARDLPDQIWVQVGLGGTGGAAGGSNGNSGGTTYVSVFPDSNNANNLICIAAGGNLGFGGTTSAPGNGGSTVGVSNITSFIMATCGLNFISSGGSAGGNGGAITGAAGVAVVAFANAIITCGGAGGASGGTATTDFAGGAITAAGPWIQGNPGGLSGGGAGNPGIGIKKPLMSLGGTGGGSNNAAGVGGVGGDGGNYGSGGGGGGAGITGAKGGRGGDGFCQIFCW